MWASIHPFMGCILSRTIKIYLDTQSRPRNPSARDFCRRRETERIPGGNSRAAAQAHRSDERVPGRTHQGPEIICQILIQALVTGGGAWSNAGP